jgi:hypothetical protein
MPPSGLSPLTCAICHSLFATRRPQSAILNPHSAFRNPYGFGIAPIAPKDGRAIPWKSMSA